MKRLSFVLSIVLVSLLITGLAFAELYPLRVGYLTAWNETEPGGTNPDDGDGSIHFMTEKINIDGVDYFLEKSRDVLFGPEGTWDNHWPVRSNENTLYAYNPNGSDYAVFTLENNGTGDVVNRCDLEDPEEPCAPGYYYVQCINSHEAIDDFPAGGTTYDGVYEFWMYGCSDSQTCDTMPGAKVWIAQDVGMIKQVFDEGEGPITEELIARKPPVMDWFGVYRRDNENGSTDYRVGFELYYFACPPFPGDMSCTVQLDDLLTYPGNTIEVWQGSTSITLSNDHISDYRYASSNIDGNDFITSSDFKRGFDFSADADGLPTGTYSLEVADNRDRIVYEGERNHTAPAELLPIISADSFVTSNDNGNLIWSWTLDDFTYITDGPYVRLYIGAYQGESQIGYYSPKKKNNADNYIVMPVNSFPEECNRLKLRAQIRLNDSSYQTNSNSISVPLVDSDGDGISDDVEAADVDSFTDGTTSGKITDRGGLVISVTDAANSGDGVLLSAYNGDGTATVRICDGSAVVNLTEGDETVVTCGSAIVKAINGAIAVEFFADDGSTATVTIEGNADEGTKNTIIFDPETFTFSAPETNTDNLEIVLEDGTKISLEAGEMTVEIDIKPGSDTNCLNINDKGVIPVAIFSNSSFDATTQIDPASVTLNGMAVKTVGKAEKLLSHHEDINGDNYDDLVVQILDSNGDFSVGTTYATLKGTLLDGTPIKGTDLICIVP